MSNIYQGNEERDFWVWVNPNNWLVNHQISVTGQFFSGGLVSDKKSNLMFIPNPDFAGDITPFQMSMMNEYMADYNLEINREAYFANYPSRLNAIFLLPTEDEAEKYRERHMGHVGDRVLKKVKTIGDYLFSSHDSSWVDFMRQGHSMNNDIIHNVTQAYWKGVSVENCELKSMGKPWSQTLITEVLYIGRVGFYDSSLQT